MPFDCSGPYFTSDDRCYYLINGERVWRTSEPENPGSNRAFAHSVQSKYESHDFPGSVSSYPPNPAPGALKKRMVSGFPSPYNAGNSQGSDPGHIRNDYYRNSVDPKKSRHGPPLTSGFSKSYNYYKDRDAAGSGAEENYKFVVGTAQRTTKKSRSNSPGLYQGKPPETRAWHQNAGYYAGLARDEYHSAVESRSYVGEAYIGYDKPEDRRGHAKRIKLLSGSENHMDRKYHMHSSSHR